LKTYIPENWKIKKIDTFLDTSNPQKLNKVDINNLHKSITNNEIGRVIKNFPTKKIPG
jgi:hypothetical protein